MRLISKVDADIKATKRKLVELETKLDLLYAERGAIIDEFMKEI